MSNLNKIIVLPCLLCVRQFGKAEEKRDSDGKQRTDAAISTGLTLEEIGELYDSAQAP